jgi:hypothetical protein
MSKKAKQTDSSGNTIQTEVYKTKTFWLILAGVLVFLCLVGTGGTADTGKGRHRENHTHEQMPNDKSLSEDEKIK